MVLNPNCPEVDGKYAIGTTTANNTITIPSDVKTVCAIASADGISYSVVFPTEHPSDEIRVGFCFNPSNNYGGCVVVWNFSTRQANLSTFNVAGTNKTSSATITWYGI